MKNNTLHVALIEPSQIISEGLTNILLKSKQHYHIYKFDSLLEIDSSTVKEKLNIVLINPSQLYINKTDYYHYFRKIIPNAFLVGIIYSFFESRIMESFDAVIKISDSAENIESILDKLMKSKSQFRNNFLSEVLSDREKDVLVQLVNGNSNKEIADKLNISIHTVVSHRKNIIHKTGIKSQSGLTIYALSKKIIHIEDFAAY